MLTASFTCVAPQAHRCMPSHAIQCHTETETIILHTCSMFVWFDIQVIFKTTDFCVLTDLDVNLANIHPGFHQHECIKLHDRRVQCVCSKTTGHLHRVHMQRTLMGEDTERAMHDILQNPRLFCLFVGWFFCCFCCCYISHLPKMYVHAWRCIILFNNSPHRLTPQTNEFSFLLKLDLLLCIARLLVCCVGWTF